MSWSTDYMRNKKDYLNREEIKLLIKQVGKTRKSERNYVLLKTLEITALRIHEVLHIRFKDIDFATKNIRIGILKQRKKLFINEYYPQLVPLLSEYMQWSGLGLNDYVFKGESVKCRHSCYHTEGFAHISHTNVAKILDRLSNLAELDKKVHPHQFRHGWIVNRILDGTIKKPDDLIFAQNYLHHSHINITMNYWKYFGQTEMKNWLEEVEYET